MYICIYLHVIFYISIGITIIKIFVVSHSCFDCIAICWTSFHVAAGHLYVSFGIMFIQVFCPFFFLAFEGLIYSIWKFPGSGSEPELQLLAHPTTTAMPDPRWDAYGTYTTAHCNGRSLTHWMRPGMEPESSGILVWLFPLSHKGNSCPFLDWSVQVFKYCVT